MLILNALYLNIYSSGLSLKYVFWRLLWNSWEPEAGTFFRHTKDTLELLLAQGLPASEWRIEYLGHYTYLISSAGASLF
jgi:hypothetical protein